MTRWEGVIGKLGEDVRNDSERRLLSLVRKWFQGVNIKRYTSTHVHVQGEAYNPPMTTSW